VVDVSEQLLDERRCDSDAALVTIAFFPQVILSKHDPH
jgi:hypothetical protein